VAPEEVATVIERSDMSERGDMKASGKRIEWRWIGLFLAMAVFAYGFAFQQSGGSRIEWLTDLDAAIEQAQATDRLILADFTGAGCQYCYQMDREVFSRGDVEKAVRDFVPLKIDTDLQPEIASRYGVMGLPTLMILNETGQVITSVEGYQPPTRFKAFLTSASSASSN
jgi:thioredoxin-related protein